MQIRKKLAYAALATSLVACIDDIDPEQTNGDGGVEQGGKSGKGDAAVDAGGAVTDVLDQPSRGAAIALSDNEQVAVVVNRDVGSASVLTVKYETGKLTRTEQLYELQLGDGSEPWQVVIGPDNETAYVVLRKDQKLARLSKLSDQAHRGRLRERRLRAHLGGAQPERAQGVRHQLDRRHSQCGRHRLAQAARDHRPQRRAGEDWLPGCSQVARQRWRTRARSPSPTTAICEDDDETLLITEYFAQQVAELQADGLNADVNKAGVVYKVNVADYDVSTITLSALQDIGFKDVNGNAVGCFPNQLQSITLNGTMRTSRRCARRRRGPRG